ncbi:MAG: hypothetical protein FJW66_06740 [Actinobacteria bacterium]|nr:hypothetical protein [Actinomycetota bacterium]
MKFSFHGTKGEIEEENSRHRYHSSLEVTGTDGSIIIDFGEKHSEMLSGMINDFDGLLITHAHPDHYVWTKRDEPAITIPVYLTEKALNYGIKRPVNPVVIEPGVTFNIKQFEITPFDVIHSIRCPAVCFKITWSRKKEASAKTETAEIQNGKKLKEDMKEIKNIIYAPDILDTRLPKEEVLEEIDMLVADGSSFDVNLVRKRDGMLYGHAMIRTIANWCLKYKIPELIVTHCGKQIVTGDEKFFTERINDISGGNLAFRIAYDGLEMEI